jgi:hypothetical protein
MPLRPSRSSVVPPIGIKAIPARGTGGNDVFIDGEWYLNQPTTTTTTLAPTTLAPTTLAPTTTDAPPTTSAPTTVAPTTTLAPTTTTTLP